MNEKAGKAKGKILHKDQAGSSERAIYTGQRKDQTSMEEISASEAEGNERLTVRQVLRLLKRHCSCQLWSKSLFEQMWYFFPGRGTWYTLWRSLDDLIVVTVAVET